MKIHQIIKLSVLFSFLLCQSYSNEKNDEQLIIFENAEQTRVQKLFHEKVLPKIRELAKKRGLLLILKSSKDGMPSEITTLPAIIVQNSLGRSIYRGRFSQISRIANFIQTSKFVPQRKSVLIFESAAVQYRGRTKIVYPIKISTVTGKTPTGYNDKQFKLKMKNVIINNIDQVKVVGKVDLQPLDKRFYFDFYPWVSDKGKLYLSGKIFSQHHCKKFIWSTGEAPLVGDWKVRNQLFKQLAKNMTVQLKAILSKETIGDSFDSIDSKIVVKTWDQLNLKLPAKKNKFKTDLQIQMPLSWEIKGKLSKDSRAQFAIAPPNDNYSGLIGKMNGEFHFSKKGKLALSKGWFEVDLLSISMGEPDLDDSLQEEDMFYISKFAKSKIVFSSIDSSEDGALKLGEESQVKVKGLFTFKGIKETLSVDLSFEPTINEKGFVRLFLKAQFEIDLTKYGMEGAPGKHKKRNTVQFFIRIYMSQITMKKK